MGPPFRVLLVSGSLRKNSTNTALLRTAGAFAPAGIEPLLYDGVGNLPHFNLDDDIDPLPPAVADLRGRIRTADAVLLSTPEYAGALPGSFKNLLDWTIGDDRAGSICEKPVAWINASVHGAALAHESLRRVLGYASAVIVPSACADIPVTAGMVGAGGLIGESTVRDQLVAVLTALANGDALPQRR